MQITEEQLKILRAVYDIMLTSQAYLWGAPAIQEPQRAMNNISYAGNLLKITCDQIESTRTTGKK